MSSPTTLYVVLSVNCILTWPVDTVVVLSQSKSLKLAKLRELHNQVMKRATETASEPKPFKTCLMKNSPRFGPNTVLPRSNSQDSPKPKDHNQYDDFDNPF